MTARIIKAMHNPYVTMIGHLTGRLLLAREGYALDVDAIIAEAIRLGVIIELNANPHRLDLDWRHLRAAHAQGLLTSINPDAHSPDGLRDVTYGVGIARKGGVTAEHVLNTRGLQDIQDWLAQRRADAPPVVSEGAAIIVQEDKSTTVQASLEESAETASRATQDLELQSSHGTM